MLTSGLSTMSLRSLAAEVGTSHRMLLYHFRGQEGLLEAVVDEVEARQRSLLGGLAAGTAVSSAELSEAFWQHLSSPQLRTAERLFFQLHVRLLELGRRDRAAALTDAWLGPVAAFLTARGYDEPEARTVARLGVAVYRGLLLDLLASDDQAGVDAALRVYVRAVLGDRAPGQPPA